MSYPDNFQSRGQAPLKSLLQGWPGHLLALVAGALVTLSLAPFDLWPLGIASTAILAWLLARLTPLQAAVRGWYYGLGLFGSGSSWVYVSIHVYGYAPVPLAVFLTLLFSAGLAIFSAATCYVYARWFRDMRGGPLLGFAALFVVGEWWRSWFLTGFPWLYLGYAHLDTALAGWAPIAGIYSLSFIVALTGAAISASLMRRQLMIGQWLVVALLWLGGAALGAVDWVQPADRPAVKVAMVQANIPQQLKWQRDQYWPTLKLYEATSSPLWSRYDLVIWPEAAIPGYYQSALPFLDRLAAEAASANSSLVTGVPFLYPATDTEPARYHNSIVALGAGSGSYHKQRLVPFGEYVPLEGLIRGLIRFFDLPLSSTTPGPAGQDGIRVGDLRLAPFICYEIVYPGLVADWLPAADLLITISNDAWFGQSIGPLQHLQMAQMRALESGRYLLRATGNGVSAIINQRGQITSRGDQFTREVITGEARVYSGATPFALTGSWPILLVCFLIGISLRLIAVKMRRRGTTE